MFGSHIWTSWIEPFIFSSKRKKQKMRDKGEHKIKEKRAIAKLPELGSNKSYIYCVIGFFYIISLEYYPSKHAN